MRGLLVLSMLVCAVVGRIHELTVSMDTRKAFSIQDFGFMKGGKLVFDLSAFRISAAEGLLKRGVFLLHQTTNEAGTMADVEVLQSTQTCVADFPSLPPSDVVIDLDMNASTLNESLYKQVAIEEDGLYELLYMRCVGTATSFKLKATFVNPGGQYLSAGETPLPALYCVSAFFFAAATVAWVLHLRAHAERIHTVHHLMTLLIAVRALTSLTQGIQLAAISSVGHPTGWSALYYVILFVKGLLFFVAVLLIGTGWSLLRPFLTDREKRIFMIVLPLQTLANTAIIVLDEAAPGSSAVQDWSFVLHFAEAACCVAVLLPTAWSIRGLNTAAAADGKAKESLDRLVRFRNFFVATMGFLYFTRFGSYAMAMVTGYGMAWTVPVFVEVLTLVYYLAVGWQFRPGADNPYMRVRADSGDEGEYGLGEDDGVDTAAAGAAVAARDGRNNDDDDDEDDNGDDHAERGTGEETVAPEDDSRKAKAAKD